MDIIIRKEATLEFLRTRRSPKLRELTEPAPNAEQLAQILTIASRVPDHGKLVPWRFIIIEGERRQALNNVIGARFDEAFPDAPQEKHDEARKRMTHAPLVIAVVSCPIVHPKVPTLEQLLTVGAVCMNLLHAARALGFAGLWLTEWYATDRVIVEHLGLGEGEQIAGFLHIGTPTGPREDRVRPDIEQLISRY